MVLAPRKLDVTTVELESTPRLAVGDLGEGADAELALLRIQHVAVAVEQFHLQLVEPRGVEIPQSGRVDRQRHFDDIEPRPHGDGQVFVVVGLLEVADSGLDPCDGRVRKVADDGLLEVLAEDRDLERHRLVGPGLVPDLDPGFDLAVERDRAGKEVGDVLGGAGFDGHPAVDAEAGRAVAPAEVGVVPAGSGGGEHLVALFILTPEESAQIRRVVLDAHHQQVLAFAYDVEALHLEGPEESLVCPDVVTVDEDLGFVVDAFEVDDESALGDHLGGDIEGGAVVAGHARPARRSAAR